MNNALELRLVRRDSRRSSEVILRSSMWRVCAAHVCTIMYPMRLLSFFFFFLFVALSEGRRASKVPGSFCSRCRDTTLTSMTQSRRKWTLVGGASELSMNKEAENGKEGTEPNHQRRSSIILNAIAVLGFPNHEIICARPSRLSPVT